MTASQRPGDGRVEAAVVAYHDKTCARSCPADISTYNVDIPRAVLAAADLWDRENGYVRIKLNEFRQWVLDQAYSPNDIVLGSNGLTDDQIPDMHRLLDLIDPAWRSVLRDAAEQVGGNG